MIFVTVGTHEQQFDRLVKYVDELVGNGAIGEDVIIQSGFSTYEPIYCKSMSIIPYSDMIRYIDEARIVMTHGGPSSFIMPLQKGKIPIVVPRQKQFSEHVNDHQVEFAHKVADVYGGIIVIDNIVELKATIENYDSLVEHMDKGMNSNNTKFCKNLESILDKLVGGKS